DLRAGREPARPPPVHPARRGLAARARRGRRPGGGRRRPRGRDPRPGARPPARRADRGAACATGVGPAAALSTRGAGRRAPPSAPNLPDGAVADPGGPAVRRDRPRNGGASTLQHTTMIALRRILVPSDFSLPAQRALRYAIEFAKRFDAEILLVHV